MKQTQLYFALALVLLTARTTQAQTVPAPLAELLQDALDSMHIVLANKGMGAAVQLPSGAVWSGGTGISSAAPQVNINTNHVFGIGSVNKTITSACILKMADEGLLSIDDSLHQWLDTFEYVDPNITIRQLLRHESGLFDVVYAPNYGPLTGTYPDSIWAYADVISTFINPPQYLPGVTFSYCNTNYVLLGMIIEAAGGQPYHTAVRERFLDPLNLTSVNLPPYEPYVQPVAHVWTDITGDNIVDDANWYFQDWNAWHSTVAPAGSYFSTPADMARWMRPLMSGQLLSAASMAAMKTTVFTQFSGNTKYGLGLMERNILTYKAFGHGGDAGYSASVWYFPALDISIAVLNNDARKTSWQLIPTVAALLKKYVAYNQTVDYQDITASGVSLGTFPNPFSDYLDLSAHLPAGGSRLQVNLLNTVGQNVASSVFNVSGANATSPQQFRLEHLSHLPNGTYFLQLSLDGQPLPTQRVLVKAE